MIGIAGECPCGEDDLLALSEADQAQELLAKPGFPQTVLALNEHHSPATLAHVAPLSGERADALVASHEVGSHETANRRSTRALGHRLAEREKRRRWRGTGEVLNSCHQHRVLSRCFARFSVGWKRLDQARGGALVRRKCRAPLLCPAYGVFPIAGRLCLADETFQRPTELRAETHA